VLVDKSTLITANAGDCQGIIVNGANSSYRKINHKLNANSKKEQTRLKLAFTEEEDIVTKRNDIYYVKDMLQPTRSFGDFSLKYSIYNNKI